MIWTLIFAVLLVPSILFVIWADKTTLSRDGIGADILSALSLIITVIGLGISIIAIVISHSGVDLEIEKNNMERESIIRQIENLNTENEDISKVAVIENVVEWNKKVKSDKYWANSPWTSWYYSKEVVDNLEYIVWEGQHVPES